MTLEQFSEELRNVGFPEFTIVERLPNVALDPHTHPFESRALILDGEITLTVDGIERVHRAGEIFHLPRETLHAERYGATGVRYLVGRK